MRHLKILHRTYYNFRGAVQLELRRLLLRPREGPGLHIELSKLDISPAAAKVRRGKWTAEQRRRAVADSRMAGASVQEVARRHGVRANLLATPGRYRAHQGREVCRGQTTRGLNRKTGLNRVSDRYWRLDTATIRHLQTLSQT
jgi:hypothetical protein